MIRLRNNVLFMVVLAVFALFYFGCEGPAGSDGADGADGADGLAGLDGNVTCLECHGTDDFEMKIAQFTRSSHSVGAVDAERESTWSGSCARCHTSQGFIEFTTDGEAMGGIVSGDNQFECKTCHTLHTTFTTEDFNLRLTTAVSVVDGSDFLLKGNNTLNIQGFSNLCANCHQTRRDCPSDMGGEMVDLDEDDVDETLVPAGSFFIDSSHYGPHHGAQANTVAGVGFAEVAGSIAYPAAGSSYHMAASCTGCHMYDGNHDFTPQLDACNECHSTADFNYGDVQ
ncbi:MAG: hypothetical protein MUP82_06820, partial [Candidatus Marinimicrobia bacterium]|nr:hypothetical protein [Candidatus Neomarinimicrobiota bacterium]